MTNSLSKNKVKKKALLKFLKGGQSERSQDCTKSHDEKVEKAESCSELNYHTNIKTTAKDVPLN